MKGGFEMALKKETLAKHSIIKTIFIFLTLITMLILASCKKINPPEQQYIGNHIGNLKNGGYVAYNEEFIYYMTFKDSRTFLNKVSYNNEKTVICEMFCSYINVHENWLYYIDGNDEKIYRMDKDSNNVELISDVKVSFLYMNDGVLYARDESYDGLYSMNLDGTDFKTLTEDKMADIFMDDKNIYYNNYDHQKEKTIYYKMDLDGNNKETIEPHENKSANWFCVYEDNIYFANSGYSRGIIKLDMISKSFTEFDLPFTEQTSITDFYTNIKDNIIIYRDFLRKTFNQFDISTGETISFRNYIKTNYVSVDERIYTTGIYIVGDNVLYYEEGNVYIMDFNGNNKRPL